MNMLDLLREAQGGSGIDNLARQFGLDRGQTDQVLQHVLPAMSAGFKHKAQDPDGLQTLLRQIQGTGYEDVYQDAGAIARDDISQRGNQVLGEIFGSKEVSRDVAQRTELFSGVGSSVIKAMLPVIASMVLGGMQRKTSSDSGMGGILGTLIKGAMGGGSSRSSGGGGLDDLIGAVLGGGGAQQQQRGGGGMGGILGAILGGGRKQQPQQRGGGGIGDIFGSIMGGGKRQQTQQRQTQSGGGLDDLLGGILGAKPKQRRSTGDRNLDGVIGMFDADGDGKVDKDVLRQLGRRR